MNAFLSSPDALGGSGSSVAKTSTAGSAPRADAPRVGAPGGAVSGAEGAVLGTYADNSSALDGLGGDLPLLFAREEEGTRSTLPVSRDFQANRVRLYGLRFASQAVLASSKEVGKISQRYDHKSGEISEVSEPRWHRQEGCGIRMRAHTVGVRRAANQVCFFDGLVSCMSIWSCPVCWTKIRRARAVEIQTGAVRWLSGYTKRVEGRPDVVRAAGSLVFLTLTVRHKRSDALDVLFEAVQGGWSKMGAGRDGQRLRSILGVAGFVRATEVTFGKNGWHPHLHVLLFLEGPTSDFRLNQIEDEYFARWVKVSKAAGLQSLDNEAGRAHSIRAERVSSVKELARYLCKVEGMDPTPSKGKKEPKWGVGEEMARTDLKKGRVVLDDNDGKTKTVSITELLEIIAEHRVKIKCPLCVGVSGKCPSYSRAFAAFLQYASTSSSRRAIEWSQGLKKLLEIVTEPDTDEAEDDLTEAERMVANLNEYYWGLIVRRRGQTAALEAAERGGSVALFALLASWEAKDAL